MQFRHPILTTPMLLNGLFTGAFFYGILVTTGVVPTCHAPQFKPHVGAQKKRWKMSKILTIPLHLGDLVGGTYQMDATTFGVYFRLLIAHYLAGEEGIPDDDNELMKLAGCSKKTWQRVGPIVRKKYTWNGKEGIHQRVVDVIRQLELRISNAQSNGLKNLKSQSLVGGSWDTQTSTNHKPLTISHISPLSPSGESEEFRSVRLAYPQHRVDRKAHGVFNSRGLVERLPEVLAGIEAWKRSDAWKNAQYVPALSRFLDESKFEHPPAEREMTYAERHGL